jgi:hypothetical protein
MRLVMGGLDEMAARKALADETALHVGGGDEDGIDRPVGNEFLQCVEG